MSLSPCLTLVGSLASGDFPTGKESMLTSVKIITGITSKIVINTGKSKTLMPTSAAKLRKIENTKPMDTRFVCPAKILLRNYFAGASVAPGAPGALGAG